MIRHLPGIHKSSLAVGPCTRKKPDYATITCHVINSLIPSFERGVEINSQQVRPRLASRGLDQDKLPFGIFGTALFDDILAILSSMY